MTPNPFRRAAIAIAAMLPIAAFLGVQDPRERPPEARQAADNAHAQFADPRSEFVGIARLWQAYESACEELTQSRLRDWCGKRFLGFLRLREWRELHRQLRLLCEELGWKEEDNEASLAPLLIDETSLMICMEPESRSLISRIEADSSSAALATEFT